MPRASVSVLIVDDESSNVRLLEKILRRDGYQHVRGTTDVREALQLCGNATIDVILLDLHMPGMSGIDFMNALPQAESWNAPIVIVLTGDDSPETKKRALSGGAKDFIAKPFDAVEVLLRIKNLADLRLVHKQLHDANADLEEKVLLRTAELELARLDVLERLGMAAEFRDDATGQHTRRVGKAAGKIARAMGLSTDEAAVIERAAPLHDVGKIAIPDSILLKPGPLEAAEMAVMRTHTTIGARLLDSSHSDILVVARDIAISHHERWDGGGYPHGLGGEDIPIAGRIVAIADFYDALSHDRPYRRRKDHHEVLSLIESGIGSHFDPAVAAGFFEAVEAFA